MATKRNRVQEVRAAVVKVFGDYMKSIGCTPEKVAERDIYANEDDLGGWSQYAIAIIYCEGGIPNGAYDTGIFERWFEVSDELDGMHVEHINGAVIGVYES